jgi:hypothetical protein
MILSRGRGCGDLRLNKSQKSRRDAGVTEWPARAPCSFLLLVDVLIGWLDALLLLGVESLEDAKEIGAAVWSCAGVCEMNDGSLATGVGHEWIRARGAYCP